MSPETRVIVLGKLGSFYLESRLLDPQQSYELAHSCYAEIVSIAQANENINWFLFGCSGAANTLCRRYRLTHDPDDLANAGQAYRDLCASYDRVGMLNEAACSRMNYAVLLMEAVHGDKFYNLDNAIGLLRDVVKRYSKQQSGLDFKPDRYARALHNLGGALLMQAEEPHVRTMNIDEAVNVLQEALVHRPPERGVVERIHTLRALATAYPDWAGADSVAHARHLAEAANAEADALERGEKAPLKASWAVVAQHKSALYWDLDSLSAGPEGRANIETAIENHLANIKQIPRDKLPFLWAEWVGGFARLMGRICVEDGSMEHFNRSLTAFQKALDAVTIERDPRLNLVLNRELGKICHECQQWEQSLAVNRRAAEIGLWLGDIAGTTMSRANELAAVTRAVHFAVFAASQLNRPKEATELAEIGRARWLDDALRAALIRRSHASTEAKAAVDEAQAAVLELERQELNLLVQGIGGMMQGLQDNFGIPFGEHIKGRVTCDPKGEEQLRRSELVRVRSELCQAHEKLFHLLDKVSSSDADILQTRPNCEQIQNIAKRAGFPIVYLLATTWGSTAIIVSATTEILPLPGIDRRTVQELLYGDQGYVYSTTRGSGSHLEASLKAIEDSINQHVIDPIAAWGRDNGVDSFAIIGLGDIGLLPLQVSTVPAMLSVHMLPSARALNLSLVQKEVCNGNVKRLLTVGDPVSDGFRRLPFSRVESLVFGEAFESTGAIVHGFCDTPALADVKPHLTAATHVHLACHGTFRPFSPLNSTIHLNGHEVLPVESLLRPALKLASAELVILSACNSASEESWRTPDEAIGFPAVLLTAGARTVVAAQWEISDVATFLLMQQFCKEMLDKGLDAARSLSNAQRWLRSARSAELAEVVTGVRNRLGDDELRSKRLLSELREQLLMTDEDPPFADRRFWAGFVCVGL